MEEFKILNPDFHVFTAKVIHLLWIMGLFRLTIGVVSKYIYIITNVIFLNQILRKMS